MRLSSSRRDSCCHFFLLRCFLNRTEETVVPQLLCSATSLKIIGNHLVDKGTRTRNLTLVYAVSLNFLLCKRRSLEDTSPGVTNEVHNHCTTWTHYSSHIESKYKIWFKMTHIENLNLKNSKRKLLIKALEIKSSEVADSQSLFAR